MIQVISRASALSLAVKIWFSRSRRSRRSRAITAIPPCLRASVVGVAFPIKRAYVRFRATCPACPGVAVGPCRGSRAIFFPPLTPLTPCFKGVGVGFSILAIPAIMAILAISSFAFTCPACPGVAVGRSRGSALIRGKTGLFACYLSTSYLNLTLPSSYFRTDRKRSSISRLFGAISGMPLPISVGIT
jgi:hypothetical protein